MYSLIGVRYRNATVCTQDERSVDALWSSGVFGGKRAPQQFVTPTMDGIPEVADIPTNIGRYNARIAADAAAIRRRGERVFMIGGDCTHVTGLFAGLQIAHGAAARIGLVWFDAHGDFNTTKTTLSGMLGGMPVAVCAGLTHAEWRIQTGITAPLPTERIVMVDVRNLDPKERTLIEATDVTVVPCADAPLASAMQRLAAACDYIYLHIDEDILDIRYVPNHMTAEPNGPDMATVQAAISTVHRIAGDKLVAQALVSVMNTGDGAATSVASGVELLHTMTSVWS
jgi:arginase